MKTRTPEEVALILAIILFRSGQKRARISTKTIRFVSGRRYLRDAFMNLVIEALAQHDLGLVELETGGYGLFQTKGLTASRNLTAVRYLSEDELDVLRHGGEIDVEELEEELQGEEQEEPGEDED